MNLPTFPRYLHDFSMLVVGSPQHSIWPLILTIWLFNLTEHANGYVMVLMIGYMSHIIADMLTDSGVPLLWPVQKRFGITICKTGGVLEHIVAYGLLAVALIL
ncbi:metal-dependent hydrolase [Shewanella algae]|uniref:metal-dependent hydrolase n=1 Tax=Shewanella algae TaxID=38313 RepID=UPI0031F5070A